jgi:hypothetical protein
METTMNLPLRLESVLAAELLMLTLAGGLETQQRSCEEMRAEVATLYQHGEYAEAAAILEEALGQ